MDLKTTYGVMLAFAALSCGVANAAPPAATNTLQAISTQAGLALVLRSALSRDEQRVAACKPVSTDSLQTIDNAGNRLALSGCTDDAANGTASDMKIAQSSASERKAELPVSPVPEPETFIMFLAGLGAIGLIGYRKNSSSPWAATKVDPTLAEPEHPVEPKSD